MIIIIIIKMIIIIIITMIIIITIIKSKRYLIYACDKLCKRNSNMQKFQM
jgi:hypothetical protein